MFFFSFRRSRTTDRRTNGRTSRRSARAGLVFSMFNESLFLLVERKGIVTEIDNAGAAGVWVGTGWLVSIVTMKRISDYRCEILNNNNKCEFINRIRTPLYATTTRACRRTITCLAGSTHFFLSDLLVYFRDFVLDFVRNRTYRFTTQFRGFLGNRTPSLSPCPKRFSDAWCEKENCRKFPMDSPGFPRLFYFHFCGIFLLFFR